MPEQGQPAPFPRHLLQRNLPQEEAPDLLQCYLFIRLRVTFSWFRKNIVEQDLNLPHSHHGFVSNTCIVSKGGKGG